MVLRDPCLERGMKSIGCNTKSHEMNAGYVKGETMGELQIFNYEKTEMRMVTIGGDPWWVAKDVCEILEINNTTDAIKRLDHDEVTRFNLGGLSGETNIISESGLYSLILGSRKPEAKRFKRWITSEVLPSIRKHGAYVTEELLNNPDLLISVLQELKSERMQKEQLEMKVAQDNQKVLFAESVEASKTSILIGDLAKMITQNGHAIGQRRLFEWMRSKGYLVKSGSSKNMPMQRYLEQGLFEIKESTHTNPDGSVRITKTTKVTGKGQIYFINKFSG